ncbi:PilZ domain-containing protein [Dechloromonas hortensis]|uniref:PilZ domain-containing protein n=1 Tax=Dechloromonas hortensis TaxID=337779 RepID=UPI0014792E50|nr:PilZ domain-containing protein [Dechloromonas hortensis]
MRERRRNHRFNLQGKVLLELGGQRFEFPAADISVSGVGVMLDVAVLGAKPSGAVGICTIESPDLACPVEAYVSVMRIRRVGHQHLVGLRFESISDEQLQVIQAYESLLRARSAKRAAGPLSST